ncbi:N-acetylmuramoyl-L-alanine amidase [Streptomyces sp. NBC_01669]|uniref:peptidoglycan recognition protein family protein n=1 Tax=Streptomyces sp. NBC_01669 TaxID=2975909 RepID=UPI002257B43D|nr:N-acetylmuramoyl-L-alanine amidase [Streptomyces sp. NBC_01669]MCX4533522.1 N-acetylmuramoyl-L-alanine amidase [Streptomyces sp. NBC_01669]
MRSHRKIWTTAAVTTVAVAGFVVFQNVTGDSANDSDSKAGPVRTDVRKTELKVAADGSSASLGRRDTAPFSMLGVTWTDPAAKVTGAVEVRTKSVSNGTWSSWMPLETDIDGRTEAGRSGVRGSTEPRWVGPSNGVEVRVTAGAKVSSKLPAGLRLDTVDPGKGSSLHADPAAFVAETDVPAEPSPSDSPPADPTATTEPTPSATESDTAPASEAPPVTPSETATDSPSPTASDSSSPSASTSPSATLPPAPPSTVPKPPITSRAGWGADESISPEAPEYNDTVKAVFVHHTAGTNDYSCADSAAIVRSVYAYHVQSNGWKDIGYNFLVDKCGTIFEGRKGGLDRPVLGAHTYGFNRESTGISVLGTYTDTAAPSAVTTSVARIAAWKLGQYKGDPAGSTMLTAGATGSNLAGTKFTAGTQYSFKQISGHRDGFATECPGTKLYGQLPTIRSLAAGPVTGLAIKSVTGATLSGTSYYTKSAITVGWSASTPSAFISKYELLVDGKSVATAAGTATSAKATLGVGTHTVQVRATHQSGKTSLSAAATVVADQTAPSFTTKPNLALRTGTVNTTAVPLTLKWKATDAASLKEVRLTAPVAKTYGPTTTSASHTAKSGVATTWSMSAYDLAGNTAAASVAGTPVILQETSATKTGTWTTKSSSSYLGGKSYSSSSKGASLSWTFTGRSAAWVVSRASTSGQAYVYVDGTKVATVDLKSSTTKYRDALWTKSWSTSAKHTVKIVVVATSGRPAITTDGLVYLK